MLRCRWSVWSQRPCRAVQLPLPKHMNEEKVLGAIQLAKDVDGFHPLNIGKLSMKGHEVGRCRLTPG